MGFHLANVEQQWAEATSLHTLVFLEGVLMVLIRFLAVVEMEKWG